MLFCLLKRISIYLPEEVIILNSIYGKKIYIYIIISKNNNYYYNLIIRKDMCIFARGR